MTTKRFFVETFEEQKGATPVIPPGERRVFASRSYEAIQLAGVQAFAEHSGLLVLCEVRVGERVQKMNIPLDVPADLRNLGISAAVAQRVLLFVENTGREPAEAKIACLAFSLERGTAEIVGTAPCREPRSRRKFEVPPKGRLEIVHTATDVLRPMRMRIAHDGRMDLELVDVKVGNRSQMASGHGVPVEFYADWQDVHFDTAAVEQAIRFFLENTGGSPRTVEIEIEASFADEVPPEPPGFERDFPIGFLRTEPTPPGATVELECRPDVVFRGEKLVMVTHEGLNVLDVRVGKQSYLRSSGMPARVFQPVQEGLGWPLNMDETTPGVPVTLVVQNVGEVAVPTIQAMLIGKGKDKIGQIPLPAPSEAARARALELIVHTPAFGVLARSIDRGMR